MKKDWVTENYVLHRGGFNISITIWFIEVFFIYKKRGRSDHPLFLESIFEILLSCATPQVSIYELLSRFPWQPIFDNFVLQKVIFTFNVSDLLIEFLTKKLYLQMFPGMNSLYLHSNNNFF